MIARLHAGFDRMLRWAATPAALWWAALATAVAVPTALLPMELLLIVVMLPRAPRVWPVYRAAVVGAASGALLTTIVCRVSPGVGVEPAMAEALTRMVDPHPWVAVAAAAFVPSPVLHFIAHAVPQSHLLAISSAVVVGRALRYALLAVVMQQFGTWFTQVIARYFREVLLVGIGAVIMWVVLR